MAACSPGDVEFTMASAFETADSHNPSRRMLALVSSRTTSLRAGEVCGSEAGGRWKKGRANARANKQNARQRSTRRKIFSSRFRRVTLGGVGCRNINELK